MGHVETIACLISLAIVFQEPATQPHDQATDPAKPELPPFPKDKAKWTISGEARADAFMRERWLPFRYLKPAPDDLPKWQRRFPKGVPDTRTRTVGSNASLPGVAIVVWGIDKRWRFEPIKRTGRRRWGPFRPGIDKLQGQLRLTENLAASPPVFVVRASAFFEIINETGALLHVGYSQKYPSDALLAKRLLVDIWNQRKRNYYQAYLRPTGRAITVWDVAEEGILGCHVSAHMFDCPVLVLAHPMFSTTDDRGRFSLSPLPDGEYDLLAIHALLGRIEKKITIQGRDPKAVEFIFEVPERLRVQHKKGQKKGEE